MPKRPAPPKGDGHGGSTCQSCGVDLRPRGHAHGESPTGTEYCERCFHDGAFTLPDATIEQMVIISAQTLMENDPTLDQDSAIERSREMLPTLKRWKDLEVAKGHRA